MLKKIFAFLIEIPHLLITLMRYLFSQDWHIVSSEPSMHYVRDRHLVSVADAVIYFLESIDLAGTTKLAKNQKA